jgi:Subunit CCDC53 of WASH complex
MALNSKRMQTFFNEFLITTTSFLNQFASDCEDKFFELERKLNKIESNLTIIEQKVRFLSNKKKLNRFNYFDF